MPSMDTMKEAVDMDDVWVMALSLVIGCLVLVWLLLYVRLGKSVIQNGGGRSFVNERRPPLIRNGKCALQSTNGAHRAQIKIDESKCFCRKCGTHVYPVERIIAEKNFYHKNCFRCKECNKLLSVDGYMSHETEIYCKIHFKQLFQPKARFDNDAGPRERTYNVFRH